MHAAGPTVEGKDGDAGEGFHGVVYLMTVIGQVPETVLRREDGRYIDAFLDQRVQHVLLTAAHQTGLVGENGHPAAFQQGKVLFEAFVSQHHAGFFLRGTG